MSTGHNVNQRASRAMSRKPAEGIEHQGRGEQVEARRVIGGIGVFLEKGENEARQGEAKLATVGRGRRSAKTEGGLGSIFIREGRNGRRGREGASRPWQEPARQETDIPSRSSTRLLVPNTDLHLQLHVCRAHRSCGNIDLRHATPLPYLQSALSNSAALPLPSPNGCKRSLRLVARAFTHETCESPLLKTPLPHPHPLTCLPPPLLLRILFPPRIASHLFFLTSRVQRRMRITLQHKHTHIRPRLQHHGGRHCGSG